MEKYIKHLAVHVAIFALVHLSCQKAYWQILSGNTINDVREKSLDLNDKVRGHLKPFGESGSVTRVLEVQGYPPHFFRDYLLKSKPVLMKGVAKMSPAFEKWTDDYLRDMARRPGNENMAVLEVENEKRENKTSNTTVLSIDEFLDIYKEKEVYMVDNLPSFLRPDVLVPCVLQCPDLEKTRMSHLFWLSSGSTRGVVHSDCNDNIMCVFRGRKTFTIMDPATTRLGSIIDYPAGAYSHMNVDSVDLHRYPKLRGAHFWRADVDAGDCFYLPYMWMHQVRSHNSNVAVNFWMDHYDVLKLLNFSRCMGEDTGCDLSSTLDKWNHPVLDVPDGVSQGDLEASADLLRIVFEHGAYHLDGTLNSKLISDSNSDAEERVRVDTFNPLVDAQYFAELEDRDPDGLAESRRELQESIIKMDTDKDGVLTRSEFYNGKAATWEVIRKRLLTYHGFDLADGDNPATSDAETKVDAAKEEL